MVARKTARLRLKTFDTAKYFKANYKSDICPLCEIEPEDIIHVLKCTVNEHGVNADSAYKIVEDLYSDCIPDIENSVKKLTETLLERDRILSSAPPLRVEGLSSSQLMIED